MNPFGAEFNLTDLDGSNGFAINGIDSGDEMGRSVSGAGDINGDGIDDFIIGARSADSNGNAQSGESYVVFGGSNVGSSGNFDLTTLNGSNGFVINGTASHHFSGSSVSNAGDLNGDGFDDLIIGAPKGDAGPANIDKGQSYVVFGSSSVGSGGGLDLSSLNGSNGFAINGVDGLDLSGSAVSSAGDLNGDGLADLVIGAPFARFDQTKQGESYVVFGSSNLGGGGDLELSSLNGSNGFVIRGTDFGERSGSAVSELGDINNDGFTDLMIGAPEGNQRAGKAYVVFGGSNVGSGSSLDLATLNGSNGFVIEGLDRNDRIGTSVSSAGDVNADGIEDFIVGARTAQVGSQGSVGESYIVFGGSNIGSGGRFDLATLNGNNGFVIRGIDNSDHLGTSVSLSGDINNDGIDDLLVGAANADPDGTNSTGQAYVIFGNSSIGGNGSFDLSTLNGTNGFAINGIDSLDRLGESVSEIGDVNDDGIDDLILGAPSSPGSSDTGSSYVIFGFNGSGASATVNAISLADTTPEPVIAAPNASSSNFSIASGDPSGPEPDFGPDGDGVEAGNPSGPEPDFGPDGLYVNFDQLIGLSQEVVGTDSRDILTSFQAIGEGTQSDYFLGHGSSDTFVLGNEEQAFYLNNTEAMAIIGDFEVGVDQLQLHGSATDYSLGASAEQTDTAIIHGETQQVVGWLAGISRVELTGSSAFTFVEG